jgi:hypothetical protein
MIEIVEGAICSPEEFDSNLKIDFSGVVKKKGSIDYVPWGEIVRTLHKAVRNCTYGFKSAPDGSIIHYTPTRNAYLRPYLTRYFLGENPTTKIPEILFIVETPAGFFPISNMSARHKAMEDPDIRNIDNCLRRAVAKEIGIHTGLGLSLWADSDPYDLTEEEEDSSSPKPSKVTMTGSLSGSSGTGKTATPIASRGGSSPAVPVPRLSSQEKLDAAAEKGGLSAHGKSTVAVAVNADSWESIPAAKIPKILTLLASNDYVKLFNSGRNSMGKSINPKDPAAETMEIVDAFRKAEAASE